MFSTIKFNPIRQAAADVFSQVLFAATVALVVGGTVALCLGRSVLLA